MFGSVSGADNEVNSRIEPGNPRNCPVEERCACALLFMRCRLVRDRHCAESLGQGGHRGFERKSIVLRCPIRIR